MKRKKQSVNTNSEVIQIIEFTEKDIKLVIITAFCMFKMPEERLKIVRRKVKDMKTVQIEFLEMKTTKSEVKNTLDTTNGRLDFREEKTGEPEDTERETILDET